ncbi:uncharacterized protein DSM5745_08876 [Aspergillus mulundensis]|uniref:DUF7580 domain-containing protein n=1 Tax=Aspergillus mulundensis TaxID=1810919 RepID=A0A3D8R548_9EURO|nr:hypothetical protein DSM5745_08876 [Aspergillus mulundensis]RDW69116.1 hypothetical protein DSM5745_08876 [Aspergillus mulundensis]
MSGVESAGLALALFPLLVNQLDNYARGIEKFKLLRRYKNALADVALELGTQRMVFLNTLEQALDGVVDDDNQVQDLISEPGGEPWRDPLLQEKLKIKLGRNYDYFVDNMASLHAMLVKLAKRLDLDLTKRAHTATPSNKDIVLFLKVLSKAVYDDILQRIRDANEALKTLIEQSAQLEISREKRGPWSKFLPRLREARKNAEGLYRAILHGSYWSCQCRDLHSAHLHLHSNPLADKMKSNNQSNFWVTFSSEDTLEGDRISTWKWTDVEFEPCELEASQVLSVTQMEETTTSLGKLQISHSQRVRFEIPRAITEKKWKSQASNVSPIQNICSVLSHSEKQPLKQETLGFITHEPDSTRRYNLHSIKCHPQAVPLQTLQQALPNSSRRDRLYIAAGLACGVIQYHGNWLKAHWDSSDIHLTASNDNGDGGEIPPDSVYLSWPLKFQQADILVEDRDEHPCRSPLIRNRILFPLALALTELSLGKSIASLRSPQDEQQGNSEAEDSTRFYTAFRLLNKVYRESGSNYGDAVHSCLLWPGPGPGMKAPCFEDEKFEGKVFHTVVTPLLKDLAHFEDLGAVLA